MKRNKQALRPIDARIFAYWQALYLSFYSPRLYVDVAKRWKGYGFYYLLLVIAVALIPFSARVIVDFNRLFYIQMLEPIKNIPSLYIQNGKVSLDKPMPYLIKNQNGETVAMIDTTGTKPTFGPEYPQLTLFISEDRIYFKPPVMKLPFVEIESGTGEKVYAQAFPKTSNEVFNGSDWIKASGVLTVKMLIEVLIYPILVLFVFGVYSVLMSLLAMLGQLFASTVLDFKLSYQDACRLFFVSATPEIFLAAICMTFHLGWPGMGFVFITVLAVYFFYAVLCVKNESKRLVPNR